MSEDLKNAVVNALRSVYDPEIPVNIYDLGLIYDINIDDNAKVKVRMTLTAPNCPVAGSLPAAVEAKVRGVEGVHDCEVELTFDPPWNQSKISPAVLVQLGLM